MEVDSDDDDNDDASSVEDQADGMQVDENDSAASSSSSSDSSASENEEETQPNSKDVGGVRSRQTERIIPPNEVRSHLRLLFSNEKPIITLLYAPHGPLSQNTTPKADPDIFFMDVVSVPPTRFRPAATMGDQVFENPQNSLLNAILRQTFVVRDLNVALHSPIPMDEGGKPKMDRTRMYIQLLESLINLQVAVNSMMDSTKNPMVVKQGKLPPQGVKQLLEKKEGLFRKNMMVRRSSRLFLAFVPRSAARLTLPLASLQTGKTSQLRRSIRHLSRRQH